MSFLDRGRAVRTCRCIRQQGIELLDDEPVAAGEERHQRADARGAMRDFVTVERDASSLACRERIARAQERAAAACGVAACFAVARRDHVDAEIDDVTRREVLALVRLVLGRGQAFERRVEGFITRFVQARRRERAQAFVDDGCGCGQVRWPFDESRDFVRMRRERFLRALVRHERRTRLSLAKRFRDQQPDRFMELVGARSRDQKLLAAPDLRNEIGAARMSLRHADSRLRLTCVNYNEAKPSCGDRRTIASRAHSRAGTDATEPCRHRRHDANVRKSSSTKRSKRASPRAIRFRRRSGPASPSRATKPRTTRTSANASRRCDVAARSRKSSAAAGRRCSVVGRDGGPDDRCGSSIDSRLRSMARMKRGGPRPTL